MLSVYTISKNSVSLHLDAIALWRNAIMLSEDTIAILQGMLIIIYCNDE